MRSDNQNESQNFTCNSHRLYIFTGTRTNDNNNIESDNELRHLLDDVISNAVSLSSIVDTSCCVSTRASSGVYSKIDCTLRGESKVGEDFSGI